MFEFICAWTEQISSRILHHTFDDFVVHKLLACDYRLHALNNLLLVIIVAVLLHLQDFGQLENYSQNERVICLHILS
jgi:hypothetical protein